MATFGRASVVLVDFPFSDLLKFKNASGDYFGSGK